MPRWLADVPLESTATLLVVYVAAGVVVAGLVIPLLGVKGRPVVRFAISGAVALVGALFGLVLPFALDLPAVFGVTLSPVILGAAAGAGAGIAIAVLNLVRTRWWRKLVAVIAIPLTAVASGLMINADVGYYPTPAAAAGGNVQTLPVLPTTTAPLAQWRPPASMPTSGSVSKTTIPGIESHFRARDAWVYLPPAARVQHPPILPVVVALSGEPGAPSDVFYGGDIAATMDQIAAVHRGVAPIVVVPDQLGSFSTNTMCVNSPLGQAETYITRDVRDWILRHLPVSRNRHDWTIAGFSQGGTCALQFGVGFPTTFGSFVAVSTEIGPISGTVSHTIKVGFHGNRAAYVAAQPLHIMKRHHYPDTDAYFAVGAQDHAYGPATRGAAEAAQHAGISTHTYAISSYGHNWNTGAIGLAWGLEHLTRRWQLPDGPTTGSSPDTGPALPSRAPSERRKLK